jgi:hypothetical protein
LAQADGLVHVGERVTETTGPKTSRRTISSSCFAPAITVGLVVEALVGGASPPVVTSMWFSSRARFDEAGDAVALALRDQRADLVGGVVLVVGDGRDGLVRSATSGHRPCMPGIDAAGGGAVLPGVVDSRRCAAPRPRASISASSNTMTGALPPSSRWVRLTVLAAASSIFLPVATSPVSEIMSTAGMVDQRNCRPSRRARDDVDHAFGQHLGQDPASFSAVSGVCSLGLNTTVLPPPMAGASFQAIIISG